MTAFRALVRKELAVLFGSPMAYVALTLVALVSGLVFFDHLRTYNQILFVFASSTMGGFETDTIPDHINIRDTVFFPVTENLGIYLIGLIPLVTMRVFAEERSRRTDEFLLTTRLSAGQVVGAKFAVTYFFVVVMMVASFVYPAMAISQGGIGLQHLFAVFLGLTLHAIALASVGLACSAYSSSQLLAAVSAWAVGFIVWDFSWLNAFVNEATAGFLDAISLHPRYGSFAEGVVSLANLFYFAGFGLVAAAIARFSFDWKRVAG